MMQEVGFCFKFRLGMYDLNDELGRYTGRKGKMECSLHGDKCKNVSHVLWKHSSYSRTRGSFMKKLQELSEDHYEDFESLENVEKLSYVLGSELWESKFDGLLSLVELNDSDSGSSQLLHSQSSPWERNGKFTQKVKFGQNGNMHLGLKFK